MEREMCQYLEWELNVDLVMLKEFEMGRCVGALAPLLLVLLDSGGLVFLMLVCGHTCAPPLARHFYYFHAVSPPTIRYYSPGVQC